MLRGGEIETGSELKMSLACPREWCMHVFLDVFRLAESESEVGLP
jgi:hypothetical protein